MLIIGKEKSISKCEEVAEYINIINTWWTILNVKTPFKGHRLNMHIHLQTQNMMSYIFLKKFYNWLEQYFRKFWKTKETYSLTSHHSCNFRTDYCIEDHKYDIDITDGDLNKCREVW